MKSVAKIFVTGDTHGGEGYKGVSDMSKLNTKNFPIQKELSKRDFVIICGDCGIVFYGDKRDKYWIDWLNKKSFTTLFVDGNHENFSLLESYEEVDYLGGKAHKIADSVYHLKRGEIYDIDGVKTFVMGGALSSDRCYFKNGEQSWFDEEIPSHEEFNKGIEALERENNHVDLIISHEAPDKVIDGVMPYISHNIVSNYLESIRSTTRFSLWCFGHHHFDALFDKEIHRMKTTPQQNKGESIIALNSIGKHYLAVYQNVIRIR